MNNVFILKASIIGIATIVLQLREDNQPLIKRLVFCILTFFCFMFFSSLIIAISHETTTEQYPLLWLSETRTTDSRFHYNLYFYVDSDGDICTGMADSSKTRVIDEDTNKSYLIVHKERQVWHNSPSNVEVIEYEFHV